MAAMGEPSVLQVCECDQVRVGATERESELCLDSYRDRHHAQLALARLHTRPRSKYRSCMHTD